MKILPTALALAFVVITSPALATQRKAAPERLAVNPSVSLSAPAASPVQAQIQDDYAAQLMSEQRQLLQQNPSGTTRLEITVGHALNGFYPR